MTIVLIFVRVQEVLRTALAMGADRAIHVDIPVKEYESVQPFHISKILAAIAKKEDVNLILMGKQVPQCFNFLLLFVR